MSPLIASASGIGLLVVADHILAALATKVTEAGIGDAAGQIASLRKNKRQRERFVALMDAAWDDLRGSDLDAANALRAALVERSGAAETFALEALKVLLFAQDVNLSALQERYTWSRGLLAAGGKSLPAWEAVAEPLARYFDRLGKRLLDDPDYRPAALEKATLDRLDSVYALLRQRLPAPPTAAELAAARDDYLAMLRQEHQYLDLAGLAPKVQNKVVKIRLADVFIPLKACSEASRRRPLPERLLGLIRSAPPEMWTELTDLVAESTDRPDALAAQLAARGYAVPDYEHGAPGTGEALDIPDLLALGRAVVLGDPGSGKSTLLKYLAYAVAAGEGGLIGPDALDKLPILVKIGDFVRAGDGAPSLKAYLCRADDPARRALFEEAIENGRALILLDALDEVPDAYSRARAAEAVRRFVADHPGNSVLLTSRIVGYEGGRLAGHFEHVTLEKLPKEAIAGFVGNWYTAIERQAEGSAEAVQAAYARAEELQRAIESNPGVQGLAENPLLLTIIALVNWRGRRLPDRRVELYQHAAETLVESWPFTQRGVRLDSRVVVGILEPVAYCLFAQRGSQELDEATLRPLLVQAIADKRGCPPPEAEAQADELLPQITEQSGIFVERGLDPAGRRYYGFLHQTFAEYFAARHLAARWRAGGLDLLPYARNPRWREVLRLMAGHLGLSDEPAATRLVADLLALPDDYPPLERSLLLVADCLADDTPVQAQAGRYVMQRLATLACAGPVALREAVRPLLRRLGGTAHALPLVDRLLALSHDADTDVRARAAATLGQAGGDDPRALNCLIQLIRDEIAGVRAIAAFTMARTTPGQVSTLDHLLELSHDEDAGVRAIAAHALMQAAADKARNHDRLLELSYKDNVVAHIGIATTLRQVAVGEARFFDRLFDLAGDEYAPVRHAAAVVLGRVAAGEARTPDCLLNLTHDEDAGVRAGAADALRQIESNDPRILDRLLDLIRDENANVRARAAAALRQAVPTEPRVLEGLLELTHDEDADMRVRAVEALGNVGGGDRRALDRLLELSHNEAAAVSVNAVAALAKATPDEVRIPDRLLELSHDEAAYVRARAATALGQTKSNDPCILNRLLELARDEDTDVRARAGAALERVAPSEAHALDRLLELARNDDNGDVRVALARVAEAQVALHALPALLAWLDDGGYTQPAGGYLEMVAQAAYDAAVAILGRAAPEPPSGFASPPQAVPGPWGA